jgi:poly-gamma-glutamate synthase PgsB/CapB
VTGPANALLGIVPSWIADAVQQNQDLFFLYAENPVWHLLLVVLVFLVVFLLRLRRWTRHIDVARAEIPLCVGGWGTRGKSGTARKKAALFQALGVEVFTKTTGCEAMVIHALPERRAPELFLYRPYDKATIWEQKQVLCAAAAMRPHVFLYECMALNPQYVDIIAQQWMRDDIATITNTYPDHEDIQGPRGVDLPYVMNRFVPRDTTCFTAESTMRPILEQEARRKNTRLIGVDWRDAAMVPEDVLARYPYNVHPMNLALVTRMGEELGIDREFAWKEVADWIVPDLGVLKVFPVASHRGRRLEFSNGHSANERHGFNANWTRLGLDRFDPAEQPGRWLITVVNNRGDRIARSKVFADCMVQDVRVHRHVLIGTNLNGLRGYVRAALGTRLEGIRLLPDGASGDLDALLAQADSAIERQLAFLCWEVRSVGDVSAKLVHMLEGLGVPPEEIERAAHDDRLQRALVQTRVRCGAIDPLLEAGVGGDDAVLTDAFQALRERLVGISELPPEHAAAVTRWLNRYIREVRTLEALRAHVREVLSSAGGASRVAALDVVLRTFVERAYMDKLLILDDPLATGDQIVDFVASHCPPGLLTHIHGAQNIKGPGLDWCYRWIGLDRVVEQVRRLEDPAPTARREALAWLASYGEYGVLDAPVARRAIGTARGAPRNQDLAFQTQASVALEHVNSAHASALSKLTTSAQKRSRLATTAASAIDGLLLFVERLLDAGDSKTRRRRADAIMRDLMDERISHDRAAACMREIVARQKGGWLKKGLVNRWAALRRQLGYAPLGHERGASQAELPIGPDALGSAVPSAS